MKQVTRELIEREIQTLERQAKEYEENFNEAIETAEGYNKEKNRTLRKINELKEDLGKWERPNVPRPTS